MDEDEEYFTEEEISEISEDDEELEHLKTKKHRGSMGSKSLLRKIREDPLHEEYPQTHQSTVLAIVYLFIIPAFITILVYSELTSGIIMEVGLLRILLEVSILLGGLLLCLGCYYGIERKTQILFLNSDGVGIIWKYGDRAIEWRHIAYLDIWWRMSKIQKVEFTGNRRDFWLENPWIGKRVTFEVLRRYIPDIEDWETSRKDGWRKGILRYTKSTEGDT